MVSRCGPASGAAVEIRNGGCGTLTEQHPRRRSWLGDGRRPVQVQRHMAAARRLAGCRAQGLATSRKRAAWALWLGTNVASRGAVRNTAGTTGPRSGIVTRCRQRPRRLAHSPTRSRSAPRGRLASMPTLTTPVRSPSGPAREPGQARRDATPQGARQPSVGHPRTASFQPRQVTRPRTPGSPSWPFWHDRQRPPDHPSPDTPANRHGPRRPDLPNSGRCRLA